MTDSTAVDGVEGGPGDDARAALARALADVVEWARPEWSERVDPLVARLREHLGPGALEAAVVSKQLAPFERVNLQLALEAWAAQQGRRADLVGYTLPPHFQGLELGQLLDGTHLPPLRATTPAMEDLPSGPSRATAVWRTALLLVEDGRGRSIVHVRGPEPQQGQDALVVEVAGLPTPAAQALLADLDILRHEHNVYRGQVVELGVGALGGAAVHFPQLPVTEREDVVLPEVVLERVERHTLGVAARRAVLRASGQHLKRGLLLYGPPGTGKTHTVRYLVTHLPGTTALLLSGRALHLVGEVTALARDLQPSVVVLEDVDLVAEDRSYGPQPQPVLFELLDAMDGAAPDADVLFLLTTNRAEALEHALAARPGRVDVALEIGLPDAECRRRLLELYTRSVPLVADDEVLERTVARTEGVTASFVKELVRRAVLEAAMSGGDEEETGTGVREVTGNHLEAALDDLLDTSQALTRALLGVPADPDPDLGRHAEPVPTLPG